MNEAHARFHDWLTGGAEGDPPRDVAVHASVCSGCRQSMEALDLLASISTGLAAMPAQPTGRERGALWIVPRVVGATALLFGATLLGVGVSELIGVSPPGGPAAQITPTPEQGVMAGTATAQPTTQGPPATPAVAPQETVTPLGPPAPTHRPLVTPVPTRTSGPIPIATPVPTPAATPTPSSSVSPSASVSESASPSASVPESVSPSPSASVPESVSPSASASESPSPSASLP